MRRVGNSSTKYDYHPEQIDEDIEKKNKIIRDYTEELIGVFNKQVNYEEGTMSNEQKKICIIDAWKKVF